MAALANSSHRSLGLARYPLLAPPPRHLGRIAIDAQARAREVLKPDASLALFPDEVRDVLVAERDRLRHGGRRGAGGAHDARAVRVAWVVLVEQLL